VAFTAKVEHHSTQNSPILFDDAMLNVGGGYDHATGKFRAPLGGMYVFTASLTTDSGSHTAGRIVHDNQLETSVYLGAEGARDYSTGAGSVIYHLAAGDHVWVFADRSVLFSSFSGFLLKKD
jgi:hypothetical protein